MLRSRLGIWILVVVLCVGGTFLMDAVPQWVNPTQVYVSSEVTGVHIMEETIDVRFGNYCVKQKTEAADIVFSQDNGVREGYVLKEGLLYSPLVMYVNASVDSYDGGFIKESSNSFTRKKIELSSVLNAIVEERNWSDIGIHKNVAQGRVVLYIPDQNNHAYLAVEELFYVTFNGGKEPDLEQRAALKERVDAVLEKCVKVANIEKEVQAEYQKPSENKKVFIAPEFLYLTAHGMADGSGNKQYVPIYFTKTASVKLNAYVLKKNEAMVMDFVSIIQKKPKFMVETGWRIKDSTFDVPRRVSSRFIKDPN